MKINFVLDVLPEFPTGGTESILRYANGLAEKGHQQTNDV